MDVERLVAMARAYHADKGARYCALRGGENCPDCILIEKAQDKLDEAAEVGSSVVLYVP